MKDRSDDLSYHEQTLVSRRYISLPDKFEVDGIQNNNLVNNQKFMSELETKQNHG